MADVFAKADASGLNNGTTLADAFTDPQDALDNATSSDNVKMCLQDDGATGFTITTQLDDDTNSGTGPESQLPIVGCDENGTELADGLTVPFVVSGVATGIDINGVSYKKYKHIKISGANTTNLYIGRAAATRGISFEGGHLTSAGTYNVLAVTVNSLLFKDLLSENAGTYNAWAANATFLGFVLRGASYGLRINGGACCLKEGVIHDNSTAGVLASNSIVASKVIIDGNGIGVDVAVTAGNSLSLCRITNNTTGVNVSASRNINIVLPHWYGNTAKTGGAGNIAIVDGTDMSGDGYNDRAGDDFTLSDSAEGRSVTLSPDGTNVAYPTAGLQVSSSGGGGLLTHPGMNGRING